MTFLGKSGSLLVFSRTSCATSVRNSYCSFDRSRGTNFAATYFLPTSSIKISETIVHGIPRSSSNSRTVDHCDFCWVQPACVQYFWVFYFLEAFRMWSAFNRFPATSEALLPQFYLGFTHLIIPKSFLKCSNNFCGWTSKREAKLDADSWISSNHCEIRVTQYTSSLNGASLPTD